MATQKQRNVHVLFVHGVGTHSPLSSLLQAYQSLRADTRSPEAPLGREDPIPGWRLRALDEIAGTPRLHLEPLERLEGTPAAVFLYEVNYSVLAGVIRANHRLDLTGLFAGFDLAVNVARTRLRKPYLQPGGYSPDHPALARGVQKLAGVFLAATVPILGLPSILFRKYTQNLVATYTRFFEDIATFALDANGESLISAHVDRTVGNILKNFSEQEDADGARDMFAVVAHSLGTIVAHNYVIRRLYDDGAKLPSRLLTFGSPIGLICWLWQFLDFEDMNFQGSRFPDWYFTWTRFKAPRQPVSPAPLLWINVVNHLDPIATSFPLDYVDMGRLRAANAALLAGGAIHHRFIDTGDSAGIAHTTYFSDREGFLQIVGRLAGLLGDPPESVARTMTRLSPTHWVRMISDLGRLRRGFWAGGLALIALYLGGIAWAAGTCFPLFFLALFWWPQLTVGVLAAVQRFVYGKATKRTPGELIGNLPWRDRSSWPYRLRHLFRPERTLAEEKAVVFGPGPGKIARVLMWIVSFSPLAVAMLLPLVAACWYAEGRLPQWGTLLKEYWGAVLPMVAIFIAYLMTFVVSEFLAHWRTLVEEAT